MPGTLLAVVDDDEGIRLSTGGLLEGAGYQVRLFESGDDFLARWSPAETGCILLDLQMPGRDGLDVLRELGARGDSPPVVVITAHGCVAVAVEAMKLGASHFMEKPYGAEELLDELGRALASVSERGDARARRAKAIALVDSLSSRQRQVLLGILKGLPNKIIAFELGLSIRTVEAYRAQLLEKLGARGTAEAVRIALSAGLSATDKV
jgi:two-component system response regulator FixJ